MHLTSIYSVYKKHNSKLWNLNYLQAIGLIWQLWLLPINDPQKHNVLYTWELYDVMCIRRFVFVAHLRGVYMNPDWVSIRIELKHCVSVEIIGNWSIFAYMNPDWVATHSGSSSFHFSFRIEHSIRNEMSIRNHVHLDRNFTLEWNSEWNRRSLWLK